MKKLTLDCVDRSGEGDSRKSFNLFYAWFFAISVALSTHYFLELNYLLTNGLLHKTLYDSAHVKASVWVASKVYVIHRGLKGTHNYTGVIFKQTTMGF